MSKSADTIELLVSKYVRIQDAYAPSFDMGPNHAQGMPETRPNKTLGHDEQVWN